LEAIRDNIFDFLVVNLVVLLAVCKSYGIPGSLQRDDMISQTTAISSSDRFKSIRFRTSVLMDVMSESLLAQHLVGHVFRVSCMLYDWSQFVFENAEKGEEIVPNLCSSRARSLFPELFSDSTNLHPLRFLNVALNIPFILFLS